jgi:maleate cis-trans isomerase
VWAVVITCVALKTIHLCEQLVDGLLALVVATTQAGTTLATHSINLIDEDDAGGLGLGLRTAGRWTAAQGGEQT